MTDNAPQFYDAWILKTIKYKIIVCVAHRPLMVQRFYHRKLQEFFFFLEGTKSFTHTLETLTVQELISGAHLKGGGQERFKKFFLAQ